jgi:hypothetical protein
MKLHKFEEYLHLIEEGLIKTYDIDFVILKSLERLSVINVPINIYKLPNNTIKLDIRTFNKVRIDNLFDLLNSNFTNLFGWFPSYMYITNLSGLENSMHYDQNYLKRTKNYLSEVSIIYQSKFDIEQNLPEFIYHLSIREYVNKISQMGIVPKSKNKISSHGNRIYVCKTIQDCKDLIPQMSFWFYDKNPNIDTRWVIYQISTVGLDLKLYCDPNYPDKGFYLTGNIPKGNIKIIDFEK